MIYRKYLHVFIWSVFFLDGIIDQIGIAVGLLNFGALASIGLLFGLTVLKPGARYPLFYFVLMLGLVSIASGHIMGGYGLYAVVSFVLSIVLKPYLYFVVIYNEHNEAILSLVRKTIVFFVLLQIPAFLIKLGLFGFVEMYVGTVAWKEGSMTTLITLIPAAFYFSKYLDERSRYQLFMVGLFVLLSQVGGKRATLVYAPMVLGGQYLVYLKYGGHSLQKAIKPVFMFVFLLAAVSYAMLRLNPWLNPEGKIGGSFDPVFAIEFITTYNSQVEIGRVYDYSRTQALDHMLDYMIEKDWPERLFGEGAGKLTRANPVIPADYDPITWFYGIRYGGRVGIIWVFTQIGLLGGAIYSLMWLKILRATVRFRAPSMHKVALIGILMVILLDIYTYSPVTIRYFSIHGLAFTYLALVWRESTWQTGFLSTPIFGRRNRTHSSNRIRRSPSTGQVNGG